MIYSDKKLNKLYLKLSCEGDAGGEGSPGAPPGFTGVATGEAFGGGGSLGVGGDGSTVGAAPPGAPDPGFLGGIAQGFDNNMEGLTPELSTALGFVGLPAQGAAAMGAVLDGVTGAIGGTPGGGSGAIGDQGGPAYSGTPAPPDLTQISSVNAGPIPQQPLPSLSSLLQTNFTVPKRTLLQQLAFGSTGPQGGTL